MRAYSPSEIENLNIPELPLDGEWEAAFGRPSRFERWFIDGESASGKSTFVMLLGKKLCDYGRVDYVSLEEGANLSFKKRIKRLGMKDVAGKFKVVTGLTVADLVARLERPKSANFVIIDSVQYLDVRSFDRLKKELFDRFPRKSFILVSQVYKGRLLTRPVTGSSRYPQITPAMMLAMMAGAKISALHTFTPRIGWFRSIATKNAPMPSRRMEIPRIIAVFFSAIQKYGSSSRRM